MNGGRISGERSGGNGREGDGRGSGVGMGRRGNSEDTDSKGDKYTFEAVMSG